MNRATHTCTHKCARAHAQTHTMIQPHLKCGHVFFHLDNSWSLYTLSQLIWQWVDFIILPQTSQECRQLIALWVDFTRSTCYGTLDSLQLEIKGRISRAQPMWSKWSCNPPFWLLIHFSHEIHSDHSYIYKFGEVFVTNTCVGALHYKI